MCKNVSIIRFKRNNAEIISIGQAREKENRHHYYHWPFCCTIASALIKVNGHCRQCALCTYIECRTICELELELEHGRMVFFSFFFFGKVNGCGNSAENTICCHLSINISPPSPFFAWLSI